MTDDEQPPLNTEVENPQSAGQQVEDQAMNGGSIMTDDEQPPLNTEVETSQNSEQQAEDQAINGGDMMTDDEQHPLNTEVETSQSTEQQTEDQAINGGDMMTNDEQPPLNTEVETPQRTEQEIEEQIDKSLLERDPLTDESISNVAAAGGAEALDSQDSQDNQDQQQTTPVLNDIDELPIELLFITDRFKVGLKELKQIKPGYVFELNDKVVGQVDIHANGVVVGKGELVQIEDRTGVRVLELHHRNKTDE